MADEQAQGHSHNRRSPVGAGSAEGKRHVVEAAGSNSRSTTTFFVGVVYWRHPPVGGDDPLYVNEIGDTPADAYRACCLKIREELEERTRRRRLEREQPSAATGHRPLRLTYHPEGTP